MISYVISNSNGRLTVKLEGVVVGEIRKIGGGYQYFPKGQSQGGEILSSVLAVKRSLEASE